MAGLTGDPLCMRIMQMPDPFCKLAVVILSGMVTSIFSSISRAKLGEISRSAVSCGVCALRPVFRGFESVPGSDDFLSRYLSSQLGYVHICIVSGCPTAGMHI